MFVEFLKCYDDYETDKSPFSMDRLLNMKEIIREDVDVAFKKSLPLISKYANEFSSSTSYVHFLFKLVNIQLNPFPDSAQPSAGTRSHFSRLPESPPPRVESGFCPQETKPKTCERGTRFPNDDILESLHAREIETLERRLAECESERNEHENNLSECRSEIGRCSTAVDALESRLKESESRRTRCEETLSMCREMMTRSPCAVADSESNETTAELEFFERQLVYIVDEKTKNRILHFVMTLINDLKTCQKSLATLESSIHEAYAEDLKNSEKETRRLEEDNKQLQSELERCREEKNQSNEKVRQDSMECETEKDSVGLKRLKDREEDKTAFELESKKLRDEFRERNDLLEKQLNECEEAKKTLECQLKRCRDDLENCLRERDDADRQKNLEICKRKENEDRREREEGDKCLRIQQLEREIETVKTAIGQLGSKNEKLKDNLLLQTRKLDQKEEELREATKQSNKEISALKQENQNNLYELSVSRDNCASLGSENEKILKDKEFLDQEKHRLEEEIENLKRETNRQNMAKEDKHNFEIKNKNDAIKELETDKKGLTNEIAKLQKRLEHKTGDYGEIFSKWKAEQENVLSKDGEISNLERKIKELKKEKSEIEALHESAKQLVNSYEEKCDKTCSLEVANRDKEFFQAEIEGWKKKFAESENRKDELELQEKQLVSNNRNLRRELDTVSKEFENLKEFLTEIKNYFNAEFRVLKIVDTSMWFDKLKFEFKKVKQANIDFKAGISNELIKLKKIITTLNESNFSFANTVIQYLKNEQEKHDRSISLEQITCQQDIERLQEESGRKQERINSLLDESRIFRIKLKEIKDFFEPSYNLSVISDENYEEWIHFLKASFEAERVKFSDFLQNISSLGYKVDNVNDLYTIIMEQIISRRDPVEECMEIARIQPIVEELDARMDTAKPKTETAPSPISVKRRRTHESSSQNFEDCSKEDLIRKLERENDLKDKKIQELKIEVWTNRAALAPTLGEISFDDNILTVPMLINLFHQLFNAYFNLLIDVKLYKNPRKFCLLKSFDVLKELNEKLKHYNTDNEYIRVNKLLIEFFIKHIQLFDVNMDVLPKEVQTEQSFLSNILKEVENRIEDEVNKRPPVKAIPKCFFDN